ncbi:MAG: S41 family peptidase [Clostridia bacterium]|nr:S41 family peptidase [Clostridia bacterium]
MFTKKQLVVTAIVTFIVTACLAVTGTHIYDNFISYDALDRARDVIRTHYVTPVSEEQMTALEDAAISAMVAELHDPYSYYFNAKDFEAYEDSTKEEYVGIGVTVSFDAKKGQMVVISPTDNAPAQKAGILPKDVITRVDDLVVTEENYDAVVDHIRGENASAGSRVKLYVLRDGEEKVFDLTREVVSVDTVTHKMLDENLAYIRISEFKHGTVEEFANALSDIQKNKAKGLIIDLRSNPGGYADSVLQMTDMLLPEGTIAYLENNAGEKQYFTSDGRYLAMPMAILVNEGTASASELMAGSTQAYGVAKIVGMKTYGKAVGQTPYMITPDTAIYLTSARYFTPKGECIDKKGITPDVEVDLPDEKKAILTTLAPQEDDQLRMATEVLYDQIKQ